MAAISVEENNEMITMGIGEWLITWLKVTSQKKKSGWVSWEEGGMGEWNASTDYEFEVPVAKAIWRKTRKYNFMFFGEPETKSANFFSLRWYPGITQMVSQIIT